VIELKKSNTLGGPLASYPTPVTVTAVGITEVGLALGEWPSSPFVVFTVTTVSTGARRVRLVPFFKVVNKVYTFS